MTDNVIIGDFPTRLDIPVDRVLDGAKEKKFSAVFVIGLSDDGQITNFSSTADVERLIYLIERSKNYLLNTQVELR